MQRRRARAIEGSATPKVPLVSVCMITYNHAGFIAQAIESVLMQEVDFAFEIVIGEDGSTDQTLSICRDYASREARITLYERNRNDPGRMNYSSPGVYNYFETLKSCRGKYIAVLEGDDYWTDPKKLQKQVDILEAYPAVALVHTDVLVKPADLNLPPYAFYGDYDPLYPLRNPWPGKRTELKNLAKHNYISTCTVMYRAWPVGELPVWFKNIAIGDYPLWLMSAKRGGICCMPDITSVYRQHGGGVMSGVGQVEQIRQMYEVKKMLSKAPEFRSIRSELKSSAQRVLFSYCGTVADAVLRESGKLKSAKRLCREYANELRVGFWTRWQLIGISVEYAFQRYVREGQLAKAVRLMPALLYYRPSKLLRWSEVRNCIIVAYRSTRAATPA